MGSVIAVICVGLILLVYGEAEFNLAGFIIVMTASALSGLRWTITQVLLQGSSAHGVGDAPQLVMCSANCTRNVYADTSLSKLSCKYAAGEGSALHHSGPTIHRYQAHFVRLTTIIQCRIVWRACGGVVVADARCALRQSLNTTRAACPLPRWRDPYIQRRSSAKLAKILRATLLITVVTAASSLLPRCAPALSLLQAAACSAFCLVSLESCAVPVKPLKHPV